MYKIEVTDDELKEIAKSRFYGLPENKGRLQTRKQRFVAGLIAVTIVSILVLTPMWYFIGRYDAPAVQQYRTNTGIEILYERGSLTYDGEVLERLNPASALPLNQIIPLGASYAAIFVVFMIRAAVKDFKTSRRKKKYINEFIEGGVYKCSF